MDQPFAAIAQAVTAARGTPFRIETRRPVSGGSIHRAWELSGGDQRYFVKVNRADAAAMFAAEAADLRDLGAAGALTLPAAICHGVAADSAFIVLEHLDLKPLARGSGAALGRALAQLHRDATGEFGWPRNNFIGSTPQANGGMCNWPAFFAERRLRPQLAMAGKHPLPSAVRDQGEALAERVGAFFLSYQPAPSLLHGDLWHGNAACLKDGTPVVFDPAAYRGDRETDLALAELFGGFPEDFYAAYREAWPLADGFETRKNLYNLYHVLNHYHLFGASYLAQARRMIAQLTAELRG